VFPHQVVKAATLRSQDQHSGLREFHCFVAVFTALIQPVDPVATLFQFFKRAIDVANAYHWEVLESPRCGLRHHIRETHGAAVGHYHRIGSGCVRGPHHRPKIVRIFDPVEHHDHPRTRGNRIQCYILVRRPDRNHALMRRALACAVKLLARLESYWNLLIAAQIDNFLKPRPSRSPRHQHAVERTIRPQCLPHRMDSRDYCHYNKVNWLRDNLVKPLCFKERHTANKRMESGEPALEVESPEVPDKLYFRIGEVSRLAGVPAYVLRYWETEFTGLGPKKSGKGHRLYRRKDVELVLEIKRLLYEKRYTIEGARKFLNSRAKSKMMKAAEATKQAELFGSPPILADIRKQLTEILKMLR